MKKIAASLALLAGVLALQACGSAPPKRSAMPELRLAPADARQSLALAQRLTIDAKGSTQSVEAMLELNDARLELALLQFGQPVARLSWDGRVLSEQRSPALPRQVSAQRILSDLQLVMWPAEAVARALPPDWRVSEHGDVRELWQGEEIVARVRHRARWDAELENLREGYRLRIESVPLAE